MTRTNIDLNDDLVAEVMRRFRVSTKRDAVNLALRRAAASTATTEGLMGLRGIGWSAELDQMRAGEGAPEL
ncbi:MAG: type II toxin-antitoxin system VapB family antitoxin [Micrococcales bacterium]|nr:type II toxin-antitoxin system VapB family antitoxin [Micrococcales bacterium]